MSSFIVDSLALAHTLADREMLEDLIRAGWKRGAIGNMLLGEKVYAGAVAAGISLYTQRVILGI